VKFLLDTCAISEFVKPKMNLGLRDFIAAIPNKNLFISAMTMAELHRGMQRLADSKRKNELMLWLDTLEVAFENKILPFDLNCAIHWAKINATAESKGFKLASLDSIIAAIASSNNLTLITRNTKDFAQTNVEIVNPWSD
jgi:predicted nucleic acid-binding protein